MVHSPPSWYLPIHPPRNLKQYDSHSRLSGQKNSVTWNIFWVFKYRIFPKPPPAWDPEVLASLRRWNFMAYPSVMVILCQSRPKDNCSEILYEKTSFITCILDPLQWIGRHQRVNLSSGCNFHTCVRTHTDTHHTPIWHSGAGCCYWEIEAPGVIK